MAFFEIKDSDYNSEQIEEEIKHSLKSRNIPFTREKEFLEKYNLEDAKKEFYSRPLTRLKIFINRIGFHKSMPRWVIQCVKLLPFYRHIRKFISINS